MTFHINSVIQYVAFWIRLLSLSRMFSRFTHMVACISTSIIFMVKIPLYGYITFCLSVHQLIHTWVVSTLWLLWIIMWWMVFGLFLILFFLFLFYQFIATQPISLHPRAHMFSHVTPWTAARQVPLSMDFSRQEYWSGLPFPSPCF